MNQSTKKPAISPTREEDYPEWYQQVIKAADLAENSPVRGCMVIKPWGYAIWECIRDELDFQIKATGHQNAYFPLFIPLSFLEKEAEHVKGFAKECAVVTHHRLEEKEGKLVPAAPLEEPLIVRPTSEAIIGDAFSRWVQSWRDLPLLINQWANVVRWEMRPRLFVRTTEFLWQEGHTVHATAEEAMQETFTTLELYRKIVEEHLAIPAIVGEKSAGERFPGAVNTYTLEMMMQDRKALQAGTSHYFGQNFSKVFNIRFNTKDGDLDYGYTTSFGITTRLIGAVVMTHSDDDGLRLAPRIAPYQVVIIPILTNAERSSAVLAYAQKIKERLFQHALWGKLLRVHVDVREERGGDKKWEWIKKGVPLRIEVGPRDLDAQQVMVFRRDESSAQKITLSLEALESQIAALLGNMQQRYYEQALAWQQAHIRRDITNFADLRAFFTPQNEEKPEIHGGFVLAKWCGDAQTEALLEELKVTIRCLPSRQSHTTGTCILTGRPATLDAIFAKSY
jgi:prolyl-tRNA synthetase